MSHAWYINMWISCTCVCVSANSKLSHQRFLLYLFFLKPLLLINGRLTRSEVTTKKEVVDLLKSELSARTINFLSQTTIPTKKSYFVFLTVISNLNNPRTWRAHVIHIRDTYRELLSRKKRATVPFARWFACFCWRISDDPTCRARMRAAKNLSSRTYVKSRYGRH